MNSEVNKPPPSARKKRRWWLWILVGLLGLIVTAGLFVVAGFAYVGHLIKTRTETKPKPLLAAPSDPRLFTDLTNRWFQFMEAAVARQNPPPFKLSEEDLNVFFARFPKATNFMHLLIRSNKLQAEFSVPLDRAKQAALKGRYLNGVATINLSFQDGWLTVNVASAEANGKPVPGWILDRLRRQNFAKDLDRNENVVRFLQEIDSIEVKDGAIVLTPAK